MSSETFELHPDWATPNAEQVRMAVEDGEGKWLHRGSMRPHTRASSKCWCSPRFVTPQFAWAMRKQELQVWLDQFFRVH